MSALDSAQLADDLATRVLDRHYPELAGVDPELGQERRKRASHGPLAPVLDLERDADPVCGGGTEKSFRASLRDPARLRLHEHGVRCERAADELGVRTHRNRYMLPALELGEPRERVRHALERKGEGGDAAAVDADRDHSRIDLRGCRHLVEHDPLARMLEEPVALCRPSSRTAESEQARMLSGAVVLDPRRSGVGSTRSALEVVYAGRRLREQAAHDLELLGTCQMRGAGDCDLDFIEVASRPQEWKRLDRLRRAPEVGNQLGVSCRGDDRAARDGDRMRPVARLDDVAPSGLDENDVHARSVVWRSRRRRTSLCCESSANAVCSAIIDHTPDYDLEDVLVVDAPQQLRALADPFRGRIITLLRQRAASTTELASALETPKGTVGHHLKVLEKAGLVRVVRTRKVRALTEMYYGRVARLFVLKTDDSMPGDVKRGAIAAMMLRQAADELIAAGLDKETSAILHARLAPADVKRFQKRLARLLADFESAEDPDGEMHALTFALFEATTILPLESDDA